MLQQQLLILTSLGFNMDLMIRRMVVYGDTQIHLDGNKFD